MQACKFDCYIAIRWLFKGGNMSPQFFWLFLYV